MKNSNSKVMIKTFVIMCLFAVIISAIGCIGIHYYKIYSGDETFQEEIVYNVSFAKEKYYVGVGEEITISINNPDNRDYQLTVENSELVDVIGSSVTGKKVGETEITITLPNNETMEATLYVVKGMVARPTEFDTAKSYLACEIFTTEENEIIDAALKDRINDAGHASRAGAVEAARFLTLSFEYRLAYFYENGRLENYGNKKHIDAEGRYYHIGLYLSHAKTEEIKYRLTGPAAWGCPLTQYEDKPYYGFVYGKKTPNGLDCSGFISWALYNGGFDVGDVGAGDIISLDNDLYDLGERNKISLDLLSSGKVKVGDLIAYPGHMAMIVGMDEEDNLFVAESLPGLKGPVVSKYTPKEAVRKFTDIMLMDSVYLTDGNLTNMWY